MSTTPITIIGIGNMGAAITGVAVKSGAPVQVLARDLEKATALAGSTGAVAGTVGDPITGEIVVLAVPYSAIDELIAEYGAQLAGKTVVDITNPVDFSTFDGLVVPADGSGSAELAAALPASHVVKAFNTTFAATLATGQVAGEHPTTVLVVGDDQAAKASVIAFIEDGGLAATDAGSLKRARELESLGFLQISLAAAEKVSWTGGFAVHS